ncbi:MAG: iron-containing alcohol dehydrogenase [Desulfobacteraceae bacterium]|nr:MAG: iron-containing alcohol dehydrogenase [Desulfobacteraceae bacterium]
MKLLRVDMSDKTIELQDLPKEWEYLGGSALTAKIMQREVPPDCDPLGPSNHFILAGGPLAGTQAPQLGRVSVGAKSPLTLGIKEANSGGPAAQMLDRLGIRAIVVQGAPAEKELYSLFISKHTTALLPADAFRGLKNYALVEKLQQTYGNKIAVICTGIAGERLYRGASVSLTDMYGDPSRNAARGGLGAVMGAKGLKAIIIDDALAGPVGLHDADAFRQTVRAWVQVLRHDVGCSLFSRFGTPFAVNNSAGHGSLPANNYRSGRPEEFIAVNGDSIQKILFERGGKMHGCMPGCFVRCSISYPDKNGRRICSAYEYETIGLLGTNLRITDNDAIARLKFMCDDLGIDAIEAGSSLGLAAEAGKMRMGDWQSAAGLLEEVEKETPLGAAIGNGVMATAKLLGIERVPAYKGQAFPAHDPRSAKGTGVTYFSSPMGADHTAGLTYSQPSKKENQAHYSLRTQIQSATCDAFGYCLNAVPAKASIYAFLAGLMNARFGLRMTADEVMEVGKQTLRDQLAFNEGAEFDRLDDPGAAFVRREPIAPSGQVFDVEVAEVAGIWKKLDGFKEKEKAWEVRIPPLPDILFGAGVAKGMAARIRQHKIKKALLVTDPFMAGSGRAAEVAAILNAGGIATVLFNEVAPDPPIELIERTALVFKGHGCDGLIGLGGGSSMDTAKGVALRVSHPGDLREYESILGGGGKIKPVLPPVVCIPTTSGTGSEANSCCVITDKQRDLKIVLFSNHLIPKLAVIDPLYCRTMPPGLTVQSGIDALAHACEGYVSLATEYHPYFESKALYAVRLIGRSLPRAYADGNDIAARTDLCMAAMFGGVAIVKGLCVGHALGHVLGGTYHMPHGLALVYGLMLFVRANRDACKEQFADIARMLTRSDNLETGLAEFYKKLDIVVSLKKEGIPREELKRIAFLTSRDAVNMATDPASPSEKKILELLEQMYD